MGGIAFLVPLFAAAVPVPEGSKLTLTIETPDPNAVVGDPGGMAFIAGKAMAHFGELGEFDIVFVVDRSHSTSNPSGADVDGDGKVGAVRGNGGAFSIFGQFLPISDTGDSILAAELAAVETLLEQLDPRTTRVGLVGFSGDIQSQTQDAIVFAPLTHDYSRVRQGLAEIRASGPSGRTNMMAGVQAATLELIGSQAAQSEKRVGARRIMMFLTDGRATLPIRNSTHQNRRLAIQAAVKSGQLGIRIDTFAIGEDALEEPEVTVEMARVTEGIFTPVVNPRQLQAVFENVIFSEIEELRIQNLSNGERATYISRAADGSYAALVPMREGINRIEVFARSSDGRQTRRRISLRFLAQSDVQQLDARLRGMRNRLMENYLLDLTQRGVEVRTTRDDELRRRLAKHMDKVREERSRRVNVRTEEGMGEGAGARTPNGPRPPNRPRR